MWQKERKEFILKSKTRTRALSWLLSLVLMLSLVPGMGLTVSATDYADCTVDIDDINDGDTLKQGVTIHTDDEEWWLSDGSDQIGQWDGNGDWTADADYTVISKDADYKTVYLSEGIAGGAQGFDLPEAVYIAGDFNTWATGSDTYKMTVNGKVATITMEGVEAGDHIFKFCGKTFADFDYGADEQLDMNSSTGVEVGTLYTARQGGANIKFTLTEKSDVTVVFDASEATPKFKISEIKPASGFVVTEITLDMIPDWMNDTTPLSASDLPGFKVAKVDDAKAWEGVPQSVVHVNLIYDFGTEPGNALYCYFYNGEFFDSFDSVGYPQTRQHIYESVNNGHKFYYTGAPGEEQSDSEVFDAYKTTKKADADGLAEEGDSEEITAAIAQAKADIDAVEYNEEKTLDENKAVVDEIIANLVKTLAEARQKYVVTGIVKDSDDHAVENATVTLVRDDETVAEAVTNSNGEYIFFAKAGTYNIITKNGDATVTKLVTLPTEEVFTITLPDGLKNSVVDNSNAGAYAATVGGLDAIAEAETLSVGETVTITLTVEEEIADNTDAEQAAINAIASGKTVNFFNITLGKNSTVSGATDIGDTNSQLLTIIVPYDMTGKKNITVYRYHDGVAEAMTENPEEGEEGFVVGTDSITIYAKKFSEYAIGYNKKSSGGGGRVATTYTVKFDTNGGNELKNISVKSGQTIGSISKPNKTGYVFDGWYSDKELTKQYSDDDKITTSTTLYAGWKVDPVRQFILTIGKKEATVWNEARSNDVAPIIRNDRTMLPARFVTENLGATVDWIGEEQKVLITKDDLKIEIYIDSDKALVNGEIVELDSPAFIENDRTYTPVRFIAETLGVTVDWDEETQQVIITKEVE